MFVGSWQRMWAHWHIMWVGSTAHLQRMWAPPRGSLWVRGITFVGHYTYLSAQGYYAAEESRIINTKVLSYLFGEETEIYKQFVADARAEARDNISRQIEEK
jgi:hypothetical protein